MNKKLILVIGIILAVALIAFGVIYFLLPGLSIEPENEIQAVVPTNTPEPPNIKFELEFDVEEDLKWLELGVMDGFENQEPAIALGEGVLRLDTETGFFAANLRYDLEPNLFVHFRTRSGEGTCGSVSIEYGTPSQSKGVALESCDDNVFSASAFFNRDHFGDSVFAKLPIFGSVPEFKDEWSDQIFWLNETGDELYYFVTNTDYPGQVMYGSVTLPEDWQYDRWGLGVAGYFEPEKSPDRPTYTEIDFIRVGYGILKSYLAFYVPAYQENRDELDTFLNTPAEPMPELQPFDGEGSQYEENRETEDQQVSDQESGQEQEVEQNNQQEQVVETQVLTWPQPDAILPYLVRMEDLEYCTNCEQILYGVELSPTGYIFSITIGVPPDTGPPTMDSYIKHSLQLFPNEVDMQEVLEYYKLIYRIPTYTIGEPIQYLNNWAGTNLIFSKSNVLTTASVLNIGNNYRQAETIVLNTVSIIPNEGLSVPEQSEEPSTELDGETAEACLDQVWLAKYETPTVPVDSFEGRVNLWVRLKSTVEKLEAAIYHPDSQTYLFYFGMDNPPVDEPVGISGDYEIPNRYYREYYEGQMLVRVWADQKLIAELPVGGQG